MTTTTTTTKSPVIITTTTETPITDPDIQVIQADTTLPSPTDPNTNTNSYRFVFKESRAYEAIRDRLNETSYQYQTASHGLTFLRTGRLYKFSDYFYFSISVRVFYSDLFR